MYFVRLWHKETKNQVNYEHL